MRDVLLYDANPSVRELLASKLKKLQLNVIELAKLEDTEDALMMAKDPFILILDMSRDPGYLPSLQKFVGRYIPETTHCILTSVTPTALAHYLPYDLSTCFFSHVVERPFRMREFIVLIDSLCAASAKLQSVSTFPVINSSVEQITGNIAVETHDPVEEQRVDELVESISLHMNEVLKEADLEAPLKSDEARAGKEPLGGSSGIHHSQGMLDLRATIPHMEAFRKPRVQDDNGVSSKQTRLVHTSLVEKKKVTDKDTCELSMPSAYRSSAEALKRVSASDKDTCELSMPTEYCSKSADALKKVSVPIAGEDGERNVRSARDTLDAIRGYTAEPNVMPDLDMELSGQRKSLSSQEGRVARDSRTRSLPGRQSKPISAVRSSLQRDSSHGSREAVRAVSTESSKKAERSSEEKHLASEKGSLPSLGNASVSPLPSLNAGQGTALPSLSGPLPSLVPAEAPSLPSLAPMDGKKAPSSTENLNSLAFISSQEPSTAACAADEDDEMARIASQPDNPVIYESDAGDGEEEEDSEEFESTMLITHDVMKKALDPTPKLSRLLPIMSGQMSIPAWLDILRLNTMLVDRVTVEVGTPTKQSVVVMDMGNVVWAERMVQDRVLSGREFMLSLSESASSHVEEISEQLEQGSDMSSALMSLDLFSSLIDSFETRLHETLVEIMKAKNVPFRVFRGMSRVAEEMLKERPTLNISLAPFVFEQSRSLKLELVASRFRKFVARPYRTALNASVSLLPQEIQILELLHFPQSLSYIDQNLSFDPAPYLSGLVLFGFADMTT